MKRVFFLLAAFLPFITYGQGTPWTKSTVNTKANKQMVDSVLIVPRDTAPSNTGLYPATTGTPVGDSGRIAFKDGKFWGHHGVLGWVEVGKDPDLSGYYSKLESDSIFVSWGSPLSGLLTQPGIPIQPTDTLTQALGKLQQQINDQDGLSIKNQTAFYQPANAKVQGSFHARSNSYQFIAERPDISTADAVSGFLTNGIIKGYVGLGSRESEDMQMYADVGRIGFQHNPDSGGVYFMETRASPAYGDVYTTANGGKWLFGQFLNRTDTAQFPIEITKPSDTSIWAEGKIRAAGALLRNDGEVLKIRANTQATSTQDLSMSFYDAEGNLIGQFGFIGGDNKLWTYSPQPIQLLSDQYVQLRPRAVIGNVADDGGTSLQIAGANGYSLLRLYSTYTPTSSADSNGQEGSIAIDDNYIYVKTSTGWKRSALSTW